MTNKRSFNLPYNDNKSQMTMDEVLSKAHKEAIQNNVDEDFKLYHQNKIPISKSHIRRLSE